MQARIAMIGNSGKYFLHCLLLIILFDITYSHDNDTSTESKRHGRVSGRIVKLYSGPKPDPILCTSEGFLADAVDCSVFYRCLKATNGKYTVYRFQCGPGTVYDPDTEICNHPRNTKRLECSGLSSDKLITSTEKYVENEIDGLYKENPELPKPISTKPPQSSYLILGSTVTQKPSFENSFVTTYPWLLASENIKEVTTASTASPWTLATAISSKKPWEYTETTSYVTRRPTSQSRVQCTSDGFMGDNEDCRKFYRCVSNQRGGYLKYEFSCSESTIWDDDTKGCNHPWAVQRRRCGKGNSYDENSIGFLENIKNNDISNNIIQQETQTYYGSKIPQSQIQTSTGSTLQNQPQISYGDRLSVQNVNVRQNQTQNNYGIPISQSNTYNKYENDVTPNHLYLIHSNPPSQTSAQMSNNILSSASITTSIPYRKGSNRCTRSGFMGDNNDCKKFYRCLGDNKRGFTVYEFSCTEGTLWDQELEACNHAWAVKECGGKKSSQDISPTTIIVENTTFKYYTTNTPLQSNEIDKIDYGNQNNHKDVEFIASTASTASKASTAKQTMSLSPEADKSTTPYEMVDCKSSGFFGNINDCSKFYRCVENGGGSFTKYEYKCGDGTVWDPEIESCNHAWLVKSCGFNRNNNTQNEHLAVPSNTDNTVITTVSLIQTTTQKNIPDYDYNSGYQIIQTETSSQSTTTTEHTSNKGNECKTSGFMGDSDCKKFYRCVENGNGGFTRYEFTCGEGTVWDANIEACNHAWAVKTCGNISVQDNATTSVPVTSQDYNNNNNYYDTDKDPNSTIKTTTSSSTTIHMTSVTNKANDCQSNGFIGDDNDCKIFYRCVENGNEGFIRYEFSCGDGTVWDPKISACNHAWAVEKCGGNNLDNLNTSTHDPNFTTGSMASETSTQHTTSSSISTILTSTISDSNIHCKANGFIGDMNDCKKFYRCVDDGKGSYTRYEYTCGDGTVWDPKIQACNHAWAVESCGGNESSKPEIVSPSVSTPLMDENPNNNNLNQSTQDIASTENPAWTSSTMKSSTTMGESDECKSEGFMGDSNNCKKFYRCVNDGKASFIRYEFSCGDGTIWDSEINACNHENSVKTPCRFTPTQVSSEKEPNYTEGSTASEANDYSSTSTSKKPADPYQCEQEGFVRDEMDCKKFYRCTDNGQGGYQKYEFTCGEGTVWDQEILACNHESSNSCGATNKKPEPDETNVYTTTKSSSTSQSTEKSESASSNDVCTSEGFYGNSNDCKKFFRCVGDGKNGFTRYDFTCGEGTIWVQDIQACDHDSDNSLCSKGSVTTTTTTSPPHSTQEKPVTSSTTSTTPSTMINTSTNAPGTKPTMQDESISEAPSSSETPNSDHDRCEKEGYFGNSQDCKKFYRCVDNGKGGFTKYDFTCGDGTIWDQDITACNHPQDVSNPSCKNGGNTETTTTTTSTAKTTTTINNETSEPTKSTSSAESTTSQSIESSSQDSSTQKPASGNYTCNEAGYYADPYDCKKFYRCVDWGGDGKTFSIYHFDCGEGTIWDPNLQTCNHEESVYPPRDCSGTQSQTENSNNSTTTTTTAKQEETTESSTSEGTTTTQQSTTEKSTTQSSTTGSSTTTDQPSTQESSTSEQTSSTEQSSTQSSTTEQSTTQKSTTEQSTTQKSTTEKSTTEQSTTEGSTTQQSTTTSEQSSSSEQTTATSEQTTSSNEETPTTAAQTTTTESTTSTTTESTTSATDQTTKAEQSTTQESTEQSSESQSSTTEQSTTQENTEGSSTTESGQDTTTEQESSNKECPEIDDDQYMFVCPTGFRRHPKYCNLFYQCTEDDDTHEMKVAVFNCPNNTIYDESKTQCVEEEKADKKCEGQIAQKRRVKRLDAYYKEPITVGKEKYLCTGVGHFPFEKDEQCSPVLFKCDRSKSGKLRGFIYQCPEGYVYWSISRRCEPLSTMTECRRSLFNWNGRYEIPIERTNVARSPIK